MKIETWKIDRPKPYWRNPRRKTDATIEKVASSLHEFGFRQPIVVDGEGTIVVGHNRLWAAQKLGLHEVPVHVAGDLSPAQCKAYRIMDNRAGEETGWDDELLGAEFEDLRELDFDLSLTGFSEQEIDHGRGAAAGHTDPDAAPPLKAQIVSKLGDLWHLGDHRLRCGDIVDFDATDEEIALLVTDPPYRVAYADLVAGRKNQKRGGWSAIKGDDISDEDLATLLRDAFSVGKAKAAFVWHPALKPEITKWALEESGYRVAQEIVWVKNALIFGGADYQWRHENCWYARGPGRSRQTDRTATTVWEIDKIRDAEHPTQKPVELFTIPMRNHTKRGEVVYDPFCGSGTALIAAESMEIRCLAVEVAPAYVDVSIRRWQDFSGQEATLADGGATFQAVAEERSTGKSPKSRPEK